MNDFETGAFTAHELGHHNNRLLDLLRGAEWPPERGLVYILFTIARAQFLANVPLEAALEQYKSIWSTVVQMEHHGGDNDLSGGN